MTKSGGDAVQSAYDQILALIAGGEHSTGTWLREQGLAERLGVSRTPVRQALNRLAAEGVVVLHPRRGAEVVAWSQDELDGVLTVRAQLEPLAAALAAERISAAELDTLQGLHEQMCEVVSDGRAMQRVARLNSEFHLALVRSCGNRQLVLTVEMGLRPVLIAHTFQRYSPAALQRSMSHHGELVAALRAGDPDWAGALMRAHIFAARHSGSDLSA